jgi:cystathionine gamma-synthase
MADPKSTEPRDWETATKLIRGGINRSQFGETAEALYLTQSYVYDTAAQAEAAFKGEVEHFIYSRYGNPTVAMFEERLRAIEGAEACFATATGMAAVFNSLAALLAAGDRVVAARALFGSCFVILDEILPRWGVTAEFVDGHDLEQWEKALSTPTQAVFFESPSNPMQDLVDVRAVCDLAHGAGAKVVVDNVFATPLLQQPLELGADVVVHSTTKYMGGHSDVVGGALIVRDAELIEKIAFHQNAIGAVAGPFDSWLVLRGIKTLGVRMDRHSDNAEKVVEFLQRHKSVSSVLYPGVDGHPGHETAAKQMKRFGGIVSFRVTGGEAQALDICNKAEVFTLGESLGGVESLIEHPGKMTHASVAGTPLEVPADLIRLSVGIETIDDLLADLDRAMS